MSTLEKLKKRIKRIPRDFTYEEMRSLLMALGFEESNKGKTSGSRVRFYRKDDDCVIFVHKPHPQKEMKEYAIKQIVEKLEESGEI